MTNLTIPQIDKRLYRPDVREEAQYQIVRIYEPKLVRGLTPLEELFYHEGFALMQNVRFQDGERFEKFIEIFLRDFGSLELDCGSDQPVCVYGERAREEPHKNFRLVQPALDINDIELADISFGLHIRYKFPDAEGVKL